MVINVHLGPNNGSALKLQNCRMAFKFVCFRLRSRNLDDFNRRHTNNIPRIEICAQRGDRPKWDVLKLAQIIFTIQTEKLLLIMPATEQLLLGSPMGTFEFLDK